MPSEKIPDPTTEGRYVQVSWRRRPGLDPDDQGTSPGYVQVATVNERMGGGPQDDGWHVELDEAGIDRAIKALHKAKNQAFGPVPGWVEGMVNQMWSEHDADSKRAEERFAKGGLIPGPEVTVESAATAAARLDTDRYRATRRGDRTPPPPR